MPPGLACVMMLSSTGHHHVLLCSALHWLPHMQAGLAEGCCQEAARLLGNCTAASDGDGAWKGLLQEEAKRIEAIRCVV